MDAVIFIGVQASGKSTFFQDRFRDSHIRINLDMLRTRHRERLLFQTCLRMKQPFVVDNTNLTRTDRQRYIPSACDTGFRIIGYYFQSRLNDLITRNASRPEAQQVPEIAIRGAFNRLELPSFNEGFDELYYVNPESSGGFVVEEWADEV